MIMKQLLFTSRFLIPTLIIAAFYSIVVTYSMNSSLVYDTFMGNFPLDYKFNIYSSLLQGMWTSMSIPSVILLFLIAILTGANLTLLWQQLRTIKSINNLHFVVGGNSVLGIIGSGCAACGLPILSILGIGASVFYLPFKGAEISFIAFALLSISFVLLLRSSLEQKVCAL